MTCAPVITTDRLVLRPHVMADFEPYAALFASDRAVHMGMLKRRHAWYSFTSDVAGWALHGHGAWGIIDRESGVFLGQVALLKPDHFPEVELGWFLMQHAEGKGIALEAATHALEFARDTLKLSSLVSYIAVENTRSIALAKRLGAEHDPSAVLPEGDSAKDTFVYRHRRPQ
ncbi:MAG: GNAT family N-acetyltransferase [Sulfitobacter sp.]